MTEPTIAEVTAQLTAPGQPFEMETIEIDGIPTRAWKNAPPNLPAILAASRAHGDRDFLVYEDERFTFERHFAMAAQLAHVLIDDLGVAKGDRVAIAMRNLPEWSIAFWAVAAAGAVVVPLNAWWTGPELAYGLRDSGSVLAFCDPDRLDRIAPERAELQALRTIVAVRGEVGGSADAVAFADLVGDPPADVDLPAISLAPEDDATIFYTSGTTGDPKGVLGSHRNICTNLISLGFGTVRGAIRSGKQAAGSSGPNVYLLSVPFFHATGCHSILVANLAAGNTIVLMHKWDATRALELIERERVATFGGVPSMVWQVIEHPDFQRFDISSLKSVGYGGAPAAPELVRKIAELFPGRMPSNGYGLTETSSVTTLNAGVDYQQHPDSVGVPVPVCDVQVVDDADRVLPTGEVGEL
ncbi:MAG: class I adenylate-forming enzyme family protein, partial [Acidimicrobiales bacterium]